MAGPPCLALGLGNWSRSNECCRCTLRAFIVAVRAWIASRVRDHSHFSLLFSIRFHGRRLRRLDYRSRVSVLVRTVRVATGACRLFFEHVLRKEPFSISNETHQTIDGRYCINFSCTDMMTKAGHLLARVRRNSSLFKSCSGKDIKRKIERALAVIYCHVKFPHFWPEIQTEGHHSWPINRIMFQSPITGMFNDYRYRPLVSFSLSHEKFNSLYQIC